MNFRFRIIYFLGKKSNFRFKDLLMVSPLIIITLRVINKFKEVPEIKKAIEQYEKERKEFNEYFLNKKQF